MNVNMSVNQYFEMTKSTSFSSWQPYTNVEFCKMIAEEVCSCGKHPRYRGFAKEKRVGLIHRHFAICENCDKVEEF